MKRKRYYQRILSVLLLLLLTGCAEFERMEGRSIELLEPVTAAVNSEKAMVRTIRDAGIVTGFVFPETVEYGFGEAVAVNGTRFYPGEQVKQGDILVSSDLSDVEKAVKNAQDKLAKYKEEYEQRLATQNKQLEELAAKSRTVRKDSTEYEIIMHKKEALELTIEEQARLYELDCAYSEESIERVKSSAVSGDVTAERDGMVVAIGGVSSGRNNSGSSLTPFYAGWGQPVIAVANPEKLHIQCEYIESNRINKAKEFYALINGQKIEVEYEALSIDEYNDRKERNGVVYSTFTFKEDPNTVKVGDFVCIVIVNDCNENVVSVSNKCIRRDENGQYVYVIEDGKSVYTPVKTGLRDSNFTAVLSGLSAGAEVLGNAAAEHRSETVTAKRGSFFTEYTGDGSILYPNVTSVVSDIRYGTVQFQDAKVSLYQYVKKGDILATVNVTIDEAELQEEKTTLERLEQRYADFIAGGTEGREIELAQKESELQAQRDLVEKMNKDSVTTKLVAPKDGIVVGLNQYYQNGRLTEGTEVARIAQPDCCYIMAANGNQQLTLGNEVKIAYRTAQNKDAEISGKVVSLSKMGLSSALSTNYAFVKIEPEDILDLSAGIMNSWGYCEIKADIRKMNDVIIIPRNTVTEVNGIPFVQVVNEDGSVTMQSILAGGYNNENYWVAEGLTEGMELCLK